MSMIATVHVRSQKSRGAGGPGQFGGPDAYVAVTVAPEGVEVPYHLNQAVLHKRGIRIHYFGEGYRLHTGPRSALGRALAEAQRFADEINAAPILPEARPECSTATLP